MLRHRAMQVLLVVFGSICMATGYILVTGANVCAP